MNILKIIFIILVILILLAVGAGIYTYFNRYAVLNYTINILLKDFLPRYMVLDSLNVDFENKEIIVKNLKVLNPSNYSRAYFVEAPTARCSYQPSLQDIVNGSSPINITFFEPVIYVERTKDNCVNVQQLDKIFKQALKSKHLSFQSMFLASVAYVLSPIKKIRGPINIKPVFNIEKGNLVFEDGFVGKNTYKTTVEDINTNIAVELKEGAKGLSYIKSEGQGVVNGDSNQTIKWTVGYDPKAPRLTMSNTLKVRNINLAHLRPYYDKFLPFIFKSGTASGELIFNFDNGNIGSMNELRLSGLSLAMKQTSAYKNMWDVSIEDIYKYLNLVSGDILFDFKVKGSIENPRFYLGPNVKRAIINMAVNMAVDKLKDALAEKSNGGQQPLPANALPTDKNIDIDQIIKILKSDKSKQQEYEEYKAKHKQEYEEYKAKYNK